MCLASDLDKLDPYYPGRMEMIWELQNDLVRKWLSWTHNGLSYSMQSKLHTQPKAWEVYGLAGPYLLESLSSQGSLQRRCSSHWLSFLQLSTSHSDSYGLAPDWQLPFYRGPL